MDPVRLQQNQLLILRMFVIYWVLLTIRRSPQSGSDHLGRPQLLIWTPLVFYSSETDLNTYIYVKEQKLDQC